MEIERESGRITEVVKCQKCGGSGQETRSLWETCDACEGDGKHHAPCKAKGCDRGVYTKPNGTMVICRVCNGTAVFKSSTRRCKKCKGRGQIKRIYKQTCRSCGGKGEVSRIVKIFNPVLDIGSDTAEKLMKIGANKE